MVLDHVPNLITTISLTPCRSVSTASVRGSEEEDSRLSLLTPDEQDSLEGGSGSAPYLPPPGVSGMNAQQQQQRDAGELWGGGGGGGGGGASGSSSQQQQQQQAGDFPLPPRVPGGGGGSYHHHRGNSASSSGGISTGGSGQQSGGAATTLAMLRTSGGAGSSDSGGGGGVAGLAGRLLRVASGSSTPVDKGQELLQRSSPVKVWGGYGVSSTVRGSLVGYAVPAHTLTA